MNIDELSVGSILMFDHAYKAPDANGTSVYTFAAFQFKKGLWSLTGQRGHLNNSEVRGFIGDAHVMVIQRG